jgi:hypothetical protein
MKVILRPIGWNKWSGIIKYKNCFEDLGSYYTRSGTLYTGLSDEEEVRLGEKLGLDLNKNSEYWKTFFIRTSASDIILDTDDAMDELKYLFCKSHKRVKNSLMENKAGANFVLINRDEEAKRDNLYAKLEIDAIIGFNKMTPTEQRKCLRIFGHNADTMSAEVVQAKLYEVVKANPQAYLDRWVNNTDREEQVLIEVAISKNIIRRDRHMYKYGSDTIGNSLEETIGFLKDPRNQDIKIGLISACDAKDYYVRDEAPTEDLVPKLIEDISEYPATVTNTEGMVTKKYTKHTV